MVDRYIVNSQNGELLLVWSVGISALLLVEGVLQFASSYLSNLLAQSVIRDIRKKSIQTYCFF
jgi:ABC-type bacteriocin/lantibiotic exporter with double-glycine peptidase domain